MSTRKIKVALRDIINNENKPQPLSDADRWILDRAEEVRATVDAYLDDYQFAKYQSHISSQVKW